MAQHATYIAPGSYYPADLMQRDNDWVSPGVISTSDLQVTAQSPAALAVNVAGAAQGSAGGNAWIPGGYRFYNDAVASLTIATADPTNPRIDLVIAGINTTGANYVATVSVVTGTPAASPVAPALPTGNYIVLAQVAVAAGATTITQANITDERQIASLQGNGSKLTNLPIPSISTATSATAGTVQIPANPTGTPVTPVRVAAANDTEITGTAAQTVLQFTPPVQGNYVAKVYLRATATTTVSVSVTYADGGGTQTYPMLSSQSIAAGSHGTLVYAFNAVPGTAIQVQVTASVANQVYVSGTLIAE